MPQGAKRTKLYSQTPPLLVELRLIRAVRPQYEPVR